MTGLIVVVALTQRSLSPLTWYLARASGLTLYLLLWFSVVAGLGLTTGLLDRFGGRATIYSLHRFATQLSYGFLALHLLSLAAEPTLPFGPRALAVPFASPWREPWTGFGVLAAELMAILGASFGVRRLTGYRVWRGLHWLTFPLYALALGHGVGAGTDSGGIVAEVLYLATVAPVVSLTLYRVLRGTARGRRSVVRSEPPFDRFAPPARTAAPQRTANPCAS
jgi:hypothetical protein